MSTYLQRVHDKRHIKLLLQWRWLVLAVAIPVSLTIEMFEGDTRGLHFLDEVVIDGLVLPLSTWIVLTFVARKIARQFERETALEQRQHFMQGLAEHREYDNLVHFIVRFPASLLAVDHSSLYIYDRENSRLFNVSQWDAADNTNPPGLQHSATLMVCSACLAIGGIASRHIGMCVFTPDQSTDPSEQEYLLPLAHNDVLIGMLRLRCKQGTKLAPVNLNIMKGLAPEMALAIDRAVESRRQAEERYRQAQIQERKRITHELHDSLAQQLFYLHLSLDQLTSDPAMLANSPTQRKIESMRDVAAEVYEQIRNNLSILRAWEQADLTEAIGRLARVTAHNAELAVDINVQGSPIWLSPHTCEDIYGIVREALGNIVKHAQAQSIHIELIWTADKLRILVADDGVGFDPISQPEPGHFGLTLMGEVVEALDGDLLLDSTPAGGTRLHLSIPLEQPEPDLSERQLTLQSITLSKQAVLQGT